MAFSIVHVGSVIGGCPCDLQASEATLASTPGGNSSLHTHDDNFEGAMHIP